MALQKQGVNINFAQGIDTKSDPWQVPMGKLLNLENAVFNSNGLLQKRKGFDDITSTNQIISTLTTLNDALLGNGSNLYEYDVTVDSWQDKGLIQPVSLSITQGIRTDSAITKPSCVVNSVGITCIVWTQGSSCYYQIMDKTTGQEVIAQTQLASGATNPKVYLLGPHFIITYTIVDVVPKIKYIAISQVKPSVVTAPADITSQLASTSSVYDGVVANNNLYLIWNSSDAGGGVRVGYITFDLVISTSQRASSAACNLATIAVDTVPSTPIIYAYYYEAATTTLKYATYNVYLLPVLAETNISTSYNLANLTAYAKNGTGTIYQEVSNVYPYSSTASNYIQYQTTSNSGTIGSVNKLVRSVGLASKVFLVDSIAYMLVTYAGSLQPSNFLVNQDGQVVCRLAYSNATGYLSQLPEVSVYNNIATIIYSLKTQLSPVNKTNGATVASGFYTIPGINLANFDFSLQQLGQEVVHAQHYTGGQLWHYDGVKPTELGFHLWPEDFDATASAAAGSMTAQQYYYVFTYEWTDSAGNVHRSAPSIPLSITLTAGQNTVTLNVPTLRLTAKNGTNSVRIVGYRWSQGQQVYYQFTSVTSPTLNSITTDSVSIIDTLADSSIIGNSILYTTGGVIENICPPANLSTTLYKSRLFLVDAEDTNTIWYSKQIVEQTPVEMSDLLTIYVPPTSQAKGGITALSNMDDKLIIFKKNAIYYLVGIGPDNTGANNDFTDPVFITSTVGCTNQKSIVQTPNGLMFQTDKGIWLLGRDLSTSYIGADVEAYNDYTITSANTVPGTNEVRFTLNTNKCLMYDYYFQQWGVFKNVYATSSLIWENAHTYLSHYGQIRKQSTTSYLDGSVPVVMAFTTAWVKLTQLQGYQRAYYIYLLSNYITPHKLSINIAYDYKTSNAQSSIITPTNYSAPWGSNVVYGDEATWGGADTPEQWRIFLKTQKCQSIQLSVQEVFDPSIGAVAGAGLTFSGFNTVIGSKKGYPVLKPSQSVG